MIHAAADGVTAGARALAESLPADPAYDLVVADLPAASPVEAWRSFVAALPKGRGPLRVVPGHEPREVASHVWQWLADETGRTVLAPCGTVNLLPGRLFVHSADQSGWVSFGPGQTPTWQGKRFPHVPWDTIEVGRVQSAGYRSVAEPLPAGVWIRPDVDEGVLTTARTRLSSTLPCLPDSATIVLGTPHAATVELSDIAGFLRTLPAKTAATARFVHYDGVALPDGIPLGQALADALDTEVQCYTGIPSGTPAAPDVLTLRADGSLGWSAFAQVLAYRPHAAGATRLARHRPPVAGLTEVAPGVYWLGQDVVLEVVPAGLWIRPADQATDPTGVRTVPLDPMQNLLFYEPADGRHELAENLVPRLDDATRPATRLMPGTAPSGPPLATRPVAPTEPEEVVDDSDLPWLSRLMDTMSIPVPARPSEVEHHDDR